MNYKYGYTTQWLTPQIMEYVRAEINLYALKANEDAMSMVRKYPKTYVRTLKEDSKRLGEIEEFFSEAQRSIIDFTQIIKSYKDKANLFYYDKEIDQIETDYIKQKENEIQVLLESEYYEEAIKWYKRLMNIKDFSQKIRDIEKVMYFKDPVILIENQLADYAAYQVGDNALGGERYLVTINNNEMKCEVYPLIQEAERTRYRKYTFPLSEIIGSDFMYQLIRQNQDVDIELMIYEDLIGLKTVTKQQEELVVFKVSEGQFTNLLYGFGEKIEWDESMRDIKIYQSYDEVEPIVVYHYDGEGYWKEEIPVEETDEMKQGLDEDETLYMINEMMFLPDEENQEEVPLNVPDVQDVTNYNNTN